MTRATDDGPSSVRMPCHGGLLDGATCDVFPGTDADSASIVSQCSRSPGPDRPHVIPEGGIEDVTGSDGGGPGSIGDVAVQPDRAEDPSRSEPVVITAQPGFSVEEIAMVLVDGCHIPGGVDAEFTRSEENRAAGSLDVTCTGGPLYDVRCTIAVATLRCEWQEPAVEATVDVVSTDVKVVGRAPTPVLAELTDTPAPPTPTPPMDDDSGTDPTAPSTFTAPGNVEDNRAPNGGVAEDAAVGQPGTGGDEMAPTPGPTEPGLRSVDNTPVPGSGAAEEPTLGNL